MAKLHHKALEAAVNKYRDQFTDGMRNDELKLILKADEKKWNEDEINEIVDAINPAIKPENKGDKNQLKSDYVVVTEFRDRNDFNKIHKVDDSFVSSDEELIASLIERELIKDTNI